MDVTFRPARLDEAEIITAYHFRCWQEAFADLVAPGTVDRMDPWGKLDRWRRWLAPDSNMTTIVADLDGRAIAHVTVEESELVHLFVDPGHWGRGLGRELLSIGEDLMRSEGHGDVKLHTLVGNEPAIALYLKSGWSMTDELVHNDNEGVVYDEHVLVKRLGTDDPSGSA